MTAPWAKAAAGLDVFADAARRLERDRRARVSGLGGTARFFASLVIGRGSMLIVVPRERDVEGAVVNLRTLEAALGLGREVQAFPAPGPLPFRGLPRHPEASLARALALGTGAEREPRVIVASPAGLLRPVLAPSHWRARGVSIRAGEERSPEALVETLVAAGYIREDPVSTPGQFARRGFILDVFPSNAEAPIRVEFLGDTIESLRVFHAQTQQSVSGARHLDIHPVSDVLPPPSLCAVLRQRLVEALGRRDASVPADKLERGIVPDDVGEMLALVEGALVPAWMHWPEALLVAMEPDLVLKETAELFERAEEERTRSGAALNALLAGALVSPDALHARLGAGPTLDVREVDTDDGDLAVATRGVRRYSGDIRALVSDLRSSTGRAVFLMGSAGRAERLTEVLREDGLAVADDGPIAVAVGALTQGFELKDAGVTVFSDGDVYPEEVRVHKTARFRGMGAFLSDFRDLEIGDFVVHEDHGIARFEGLDTIEVAGLRVDFMVLAYQGGDKLKVPVEAFDRIQKYTAPEGARPALDRLGSGKWETVKRRVRKAMRDMAEELLRLYAQRKARPGHAFTSQSPWQREFEESFEFDETPDQAQAIADVARDMATPTPMDRLVCGDVGYGKTEVAMRAAMRAILDGKQVAVLAPTTILAFQHWKTFRRRFAPFPIAVEMVSRFRTAKEIKTALAAAADGKVDILIGTHRLLSKDVVFRDLGLLIIDEEQRFGVAAKEKLKHLQTTVDCLTLSATPIPRTLQMALSGLRDMSVIETAPKDRLAIQTSILRYSEDAVAAAIRQELGRDGQVFFVHNRVETIESFGARLAELVPEARVAVAHGQMPEAELERRMLAFVEGRADVLVASTIVENGLDIPRANTILINRADQFGLAQLYQLRGRVGRSDRRASAYLLVPPDAVLSEIARKRLAAIQEFSELGAGFRIAALDLELRGAGNLLGGEQSGHIEAVGLDLYIKLLEQQVMELRGEAPASRARATLNLRLDLAIPSDYVPDVQQRMSFYKRLADARSGPEIDALGREIADRNGKAPSPVTDLLRSALVRLRADRAGIAQVDRVGGVLAVRFVPEAPLDVEALLRYATSARGAALTPDGVLRVTAGADPLRSVEDLLAAVETSSDALAGKAS